jgi:hypothetical protein
MKLSGNGRCFLRDYGPFPGGRSAGVRRGDRAGGAEPLAGGQGGQQQEGERVRNAGEYNPAEREMANK